MKNKKLESLLNKVVSFNSKKHNTIIKGFLYKDKNESNESSYYIKVIETNDNNDSIECNTIVKLVKDDEKYVSFSEKPKLMRVSLKSWHYKLVKFVLGNNAPTPKTMQNGCPYAWLLILSMLVSPFVLIFKSFIYLLNVIDNIVFKLLENISDDWINHISDEQAYQIYWSRTSDNSLNDMPITVRRYFNKKHDNYVTGCEFLKTYIEKKYNIKEDRDVVMFSKKRTEIKTKWNEWVDTVHKRRLEYDEKLTLKREERKRKEIEYKEKWDKRLKPLNDSFDKFINFFTIDTSNWGFLIKRTKQIVGGFISILLLIASYFLVLGLVYLLTLFINFSIDNWYYYLMFFIGLLIIGLFYLLFVLTTGWIQTMVNKYKNGRRIWYVEPFIYLGYYPLKYVLISIFYILWIPIKFIGYSFIYKFVGLNLVRFSRWIWRGILSSSGIFGEYFNASYTDYCPGIEWLDTEEEDN